MGDFLPSEPGTCEICSVEHKPELPHDAQSLFYQYKFYNEHGRWPTWKDAMAHCSKEMKKHWVSELRKKGVEVNRE